MKRMRAAILSIGDELTLGQQLDTNSQWLAQRLAEQSIITIEHRTVADDRGALSASIKDLAGRCDLLILTGGLGPTEDDLTREALADVATPGRPLVTDEPALAHIVELFQKRHRVMPDMNRKQAQRPDTMRCLANPHGTAPGLAGAIGSCAVFALPGPPGEMQPMFIRQVLRSFRSTDQATQVVLTASVHEFGMGESVAAEKLGDRMARDRNPLIGTTVSGGIVSARIRVEGAGPDAQSKLAETIEFIERAWQPYAFGTQEPSIGDSAAQLLMKQQKSVATAESCTGGWLGKTLVDRPGSSAYYRGGWIAYSNDFKTDFLDVPEDVIRRHGAVSRETALSLASGALNKSQADLAVSITGIAGPDGGSPAKPVGTVHIGLAARGAAEMTLTGRHFLFHGDRTAIRDRAVKAAMQMLRFALLGVPADVPLIWEVNPGGGTSSKAVREATAR